MPSTPLMLSSIGVATVSAITFGLAPGYCARTTTDGGATSGYSEIGIARIASRPATKISTDITPAKIGRSMKNFEMFMAFPRRYRASSSFRLRMIFSENRYPLFGIMRLALRDRALGLRLQFRPVVHAHGLRREQRAGPDPLQAVDHDLLARLQPARHDAQAVRRHRSERDLAVFRLALGIDHHHEALALVGADRALVHGEI